MNTYVQFDDVTIIIRLHRTTRLGLVALYESLTMIVTSILSSKYNRTQAFVEITFSTEYLGAGEATLIFHPFRLMTCSNFLNFSYSKLFRIKTSWFRYFVMQGFI